jgi:hypothetical protein
MSALADHGGLNSHRSSFKPVQNVLMAMKRQDKPENT